MSTSLGLVERVALKWARTIHHNGGHPDITVGTLRFALQLWISVLLIFILAIICSVFFGTTWETLSSLVTLGLLRYFSGGWHFRSLEICIVFTSMLAVVVPLLPDTNYYMLMLMNGFSLLSVLLYAPTGDGQQLRSATQRKIFLWVAVTIVLINFFSLAQSVTTLIFCQSLTLLPIRRR